MIIPFGKHRGKELRILPCSYLQWLSEIDPKPTIAVQPEKRERYHKERLALKLEAQRILRERALNDVTVLDDGKAVQRSRYLAANRNRSNRSHHLGKHP